MVKTFHCLFGENVIQIKSTRPYSWNGLKLYQDRLKYAQIGRNPEVFIPPGISRTNKYVGLQDYLRRFSLYLRN